MNIKSLLLGSAAALVAVSGARAADAIVAAEPEPVEYVRVCDAFGNGYFYIPGTETCLKIGGYIRYDIGVGDIFEVTSATGDQTYFKRARASFQVSTASETELGTLRTYTETRWQFDTNSLVDAASAASAPARIGVSNGFSTDSELTINFAWLQLGGFRIGKDESFFTTWTGYAGPVINDGAIYDPGPFDTNLASFTYNGGAFRAGISLEQGDDSFNTANFLIAAGTPATAATTSGWGIDDYAPHVVVGLGYTAGIFDISAVLGYDTRDDFPILGLNRGGAAGKIRVDAAVNDQLSLMAMLHYGENSSAYTAWANGPATGETFAVTAGGSYNFNEKTTLNVQGQWRESNVAANSDAFSLVGNVTHELVPGLRLTPELVWRDFGTAAGDEFGGYFRFQRSF